MLWLLAPAFGSGFWLWLWLEAVGVPQGKRKVQVAGGRWQQVGVGHGKVRSVWMTKV